jgi:mannose-6-phosphate isomerase
MLRFQPYYQPALWGGRRLHEDFGRPLPEGKVGESWELVELPERESAVVDGPHKGKKLGEMWRAGALGGTAKGQFPFLLKWIDAQQKLSVQVHPDQAACTKLGKGNPKTEAWYVANSEPKACLMIGHYPGLDALTLKQAASGGTLQKWLYETRPRIGDMFLLDAGTVHAIGSGFLLLEVQQPSDTTFRIYDWGRVGTDGQPRQLHLEEASVSVSYHKYGAPRALRQAVQGPCFYMRTLKAGSVVGPRGLRVLVADTGPATLTAGTHDVALGYGDVIVAEPGDGDITLKAGTTVLLTEPGEAAALPSS